MSAMTDSEFQSEMDEFMDSMTKQFGGYQSFRMWSQRVWSITVDESVSVSVSFPAVRFNENVNVTPVISLSEWLDGVFEWGSHSEWLREVLT